MSGEGPPDCPGAGCGLPVGWDGLPDGDGVRCWRCACGWFGYTLPPEYAARHPEEGAVQAVGRLAKRRPERASAASELPSPTRPVLTPEEHTDCALLPEEYARRASLLQRVRHANLLT